jgi:hypothetical protein
LKLKKNSKKKELTDERVFDKKCVWYLRNSNPKQLYTSLNEKPHVSVLARKTNRFSSIKLNRRAVAGS